MCSSLVNRAFPPNVRQVLAVPQIIIQPGQNPWFALLSLSKQTQLICLLRWEIWWNDERQFDKWSEITVLPIVSDFIPFSGACYLHPRLSQIPICRLCKYQQRGYFRLCKGHTIGMNVHSVKDRNCVQAINVIESCIELNSLDRNRGTEAAIRTTDPVLQENTI